MPSIPDLSKTAPSRRRAFALLAGFLIALLDAPARAQEKGNYEGAIAPDSLSLPFSLTIRDGGDGLEGFFSVPDAGVNNEPVLDLRIDGNTVSWTVDPSRFVGAVEPLKFEGSRDGDRLSGTHVGDFGELTWTAERVGDAALESVATLSVRPETLQLTAGETRRLDIVAKDPEGNEVEPAGLSYTVLGEGIRNPEESDGNSEGGDVGPPVGFVPGAQGLAITDEGEVRTSRGGEFTILVLAEVGSIPLRANVAVTVAWPATSDVRIEGLPDRLTEGNSYRIASSAWTEGGLERTDLTPDITSSNPAVVTVSPAGAVRAERPGRATITAQADGIERTWNVRVDESPVGSLALTADRRIARTGDVVTIQASARDKRGRALDAVPIAYSVEAFPSDTQLAPPSAAQIGDDGRFVAERPGAYVIYASSGRVAASVEVKVIRRDVRQRVELMGQGPISAHHTSDLWVWEGVDGRDYAITGTWSDEAYFWDVTDPRNITKIGSVEVDARMVNDVKVSEDGRIAVISREGASDRRNGIVLYDVSDPRNVEEIGRYDDGLTGGVHNLFIYEDHVYAVSAGQRFVILSIEDPSSPAKVGSFELAPDAGIHDVWVEDGIAYSSNWNDGVVLVDVGNGVAGGSPENPVKVAQYAYPGPNHAAFPFRSESTGKFYVIAGDEIPCASFLTEPCEWQGYFHFIDFTDPENPVEVARYEVPEAGSHNLWVDGDRLYVAYYNGGLRVVDISGELIGDLYRQGREIASYRAYDPNGNLPNAPMAWGAQPHNGTVFFSDFNSGLWAVKLEPRREPDP